MCNQCKFCHKTFIGFYFAFIYDKLHLLQPSSILRHNFVATFNGGGKK